MRAPRLDAVRKRIPPAAKHLHSDVTHLARWRRLPVARPTRRFVKAHGLRVQHGPFAGMTYPSSAVGRAEQLVAKLLGSYELELHEPLARLTAEPWEQIVDIGAGDGYYAVGLARSCPGAVVRAWEMNPLPARVCLEVARANGVQDRIVMAGECDLDELRALPDRHTLVVSDCEGCEDRLLDPGAVPLLRRSTLVVELHDSLAPGVEERLAERFRSTHEIQAIGMAPRHAGEHPGLDGLNYMEQELLVSEFRINAVRWAVMRPFQTA